MRYFNTVGVTNPEKHYFLPHRLNWKQLEEFIEKEYYFILHAPRQSGKTTAIIEFVRKLNQQGNYIALHMSTESAHTAVNDVPRAMKQLLERLQEVVINTFATQQNNLFNYQVLSQYIEQQLKKPESLERSFFRVLRFWSEESRKPVVLFLDEFDGLMGDSLVALLKQFRDGYQDRPEHFPQTICLIGVRDLRDYKIKTKTQEELGVLYSPFNVKAESIVLPNFSEEDVRTLYLQHTQETGQQFTEEAIEYAYYLTQGQPWLVNALAYQACFRDVQDRSITITKEIIKRAKEELILRRDTHLDALVDRLQEPRVRGIIDAMISGNEKIHNFAPDDISYCCDLGLLAIREKCLVIANPIYQEILPRELTHSTQLSLVKAKTAFYVDAHNGLLNVPKLLNAFQQFYREGADTWLEDFTYKESGPHLLLMAFLQRVINGGGTLHREYGLGRGRADLLIHWKQQRIVVEVKILRGEKTVIEGLEQTAEYMDTANATEGHLVMFDPRKKSWDEKIYREQRQEANKTIEVWGC
jgi:type II secretory pathway predicted ATPase ExeA